MPYDASVVDPSVQNARLIITDRVEVTFVRDYCDSESAFRLMEM